MSSGTHDLSICALCGNHAQETQPLFSPDGAVRTAVRVDCRTCGVYGITYLEHALLLKNFKHNCSERLRLSAATRNASERGEWLELSSDAATAILERLPQPDPTEAADLLLEYIGRHSRPGGNTVHLDRHRDFPLIYAEGENEFLFVLKALSEKGWIERTDKSDRPQYRLTMDGYERLKAVRVRNDSDGSSRRITAVPGPSGGSFDIFLSHASEDTETIARPLYEALLEAGVTVWFDGATLELGDSLRRKIDDGLSRSRYGVVILSPRFLQKDWPQRELDGLIARETASGDKAILPIWHELDAKTLLTYSPTLADRLAGRSEDGIPSLVGAIRRVLIRTARRPSDAQAPKRIMRTEWLAQEARFKARSKVSGIWMQSTDSPDVTWSLMPMAGGSIDDVGRFRADAILAARLLAEAGLIPRLGANPEDDWLNAVRALAASDRDMALSSRDQNGKTQQGRAIDDLAERSAYACALLAGGATLSGS